MRASLQLGRVVVRPSVCVSVAVCMLADNGVRLTANAGSSEFFNTFAFILRKALLLSGCWSRRTVQFVQCVTSFRHFSSSSMSLSCGLFL